jgi:YD repeat-containing protein
MTSTRDDSSSGAATLPRYGYVPNEPNTPSTKAKERSRSLKINLLVHILWLALPLYFYGRLLTSDAYRRSVNLAKSSPALEKILGTAIETRGFPIGSALRSYGSDFAEWSVALEGSAGIGKLYGVANRIGSAWEFSRLTFAPAKGGSIIDLTPTPSRLRLSPVNSKKVYLIPLSLAPDESLDWAPAYYRAKLGVDVEILSPVQLSPAEQDQKRHQYVAEKCIDLISRSYRNISSDPSAILVGVTSQDMFIGAFDWSYAENFRVEGRFAVVSAARLQPTDYPGKWNKELLASRLQKMLTKNIAILYFNLPLSSDYTSLLSAGVLSGEQVDYMSGQIIGAKGHWVSLQNGGAPLIGITVAPGKPTSWTMDGVGYSAPNTHMEYFNADLSVGLFLDRKIDFYFDDEYPLQFARVYINGDDRPRQFGAGTMDSLDIFLIGQMDAFVDLIQEGGGRVHFVHINAKPGEPSENYRATTPGRFTNAVFEGAGWRVMTKDGWTYYFPYRAKAQDIDVTVLTGFVDPTGHKYEMARDDSGDLLSIVTPSGKWLHFEHDAAHRFHRITGSGGRSVQYDYNSSGQLVRVRDSEGQSESYTYNDRNEMLSVVDAAGTPVITNEYTSLNMISSQTFGNRERLEFGYNLGARREIRQNFLKDPNGLMSYFDYGPKGYVQSLPTQQPH